MKKHEKLAYLKEIDFDRFITMRNLVKNELSERQPMYCCCGKLATGLHESHCKKFNEMVDSVVIKRLYHLLPKK